MSIGSSICFSQVIAEYLQKIDPKSDGAKRDWVAIYDECASVLYQVIIFFGLDLSLFEIALCKLFSHSDELFFNCNKKNSKKLQRSIQEDSWMCLGFPYSTIRFLMNLLLLFKY